ncbi:MAG: hypothetical protein FWC40_05970 [Proteobacteria bacterium]|nr:hypothetical protein [Pseudomonadota bacterium]
MASDAWVFVCVSILAAREEGEGPVKDDVREKGLAEREAVRCRHEAMAGIWGFKKAPVSEKGFQAGEAVQSRGRILLKAVLTLVGGLVVVFAIVVVIIFARELIEDREQAAYLARHEASLVQEEARRLLAEYAEIAFLDSFPPSVRIALQGVPLYARTPQGYYTDLRAHESTWIRYLPVQESTVLRFDFAAEGFLPLSRQVAYYDWFPVRKGDITLQRIFRSIVLTPDTSPRLPYCEEEACEWTVFREIMFREQYGQMAQGILFEPSEKIGGLANALKVHPSLAAIAGVDLTQPIGQGLAEREGLGAEARNLLRYLTDHPFALYGQMTITTDTPGTRVFFLGEPLMAFRSSGAMSQVRVEPGEPFVFSTYGQGHPIVITDKLSLRLEAPDAPGYVTEILPHQWRCEPVEEEAAKGLFVPKFAQVEGGQDLQHYLCRYAIQIDVNFEAIREADQKSKAPADDASDSGSSDLGAGPSHRPVSS